jgi:hypothetical protein
MHNKYIFPMMLMAALVFTFSTTEAKAEFPFPPGLPAPPNVNVRINGYLPAPPGVHVQIDAGRPYYVERDRRIYIEKEKPVKHYKKKKKHHEDQGREHGHDGQRGRDN